MVSDFRELNTFFRRIYGRSRREESEIRMSKDIGYCISCGAANEADTTTCFACGDALKLSTGDEGTKQVDATEELLHGRYRLLGPAGEGGFARVYRAEDVEQHK